MPLLTNEDKNGGHRGGQDAAEVPPPKSLPRPKAART